MMVRSTLSNDGRTLGFMAGAKQLAHGLARNDSLATLSLAGNNPNLNPKP